MQNKRTKEREIIMNTGAARKIAQQSHRPRNIVLTVYKRQDGLLAQRLAGAAMLLLALVQIGWGTELSGLVILAPMAAAAIFSKEKLMDFRVFRGTSRPPRREFFHGKPRTEPT